MKASGYYCTIADFELFISEMTMIFSNLKNQLQQQPKPVAFLGVKTDRQSEQRLILVERNLLVLSSCWNLCLYQRATNASAINIPEEAAEMYFSWFKDRVDQHITKH